MDCSIGVLRPGGLLVTIVGRRDFDLAARTEAVGRRFAGVSVEPDYPALEALAGLADSGQLRVHLQATLSLAEATKAHELIESGSVTGKIALTARPGIDRALAAGPAAPARHPDRY